MFVNTFLHHDFACLNVLHVFSEPEPECRTDPECLLHLACLHQSCQDPCPTIRCGVNAECKVNSHRPYCVCKRGFEGSPQTVCEERKFLHILFLSRQCVCAPMLCSFLAGCKSDYECRDDQACISRECQNPCLFKECGINAKCEARNHRAHCVCPPYHDGNPERHCKPYECLEDPDCSTTLTCQNRKCVDPCKCAINAYCTRRNHEGICTCNTGYTGYPYGYQCTESKPQVFCKSLYPL